MLVLYINRQVEVARSMSKESDAPEAEEDSLKGRAPKIEDGLEVIYLGT